VHDPSRGAYPPTDQGSELCLTMVGTPKQAPLHEVMRFAVACHTKIAMQLAMLWAAIIPDFYAKIEYLSHVCP
jgi:hypothetical protein